MANKFIFTDIVIVRDITNTARTLTFDHSSGASRITSGNDQEIRITSGPGTTQNGASGAIRIATGSASGQSGISGDLFLSTGNIATTYGGTGTIKIFSGDSTTGVAGGVEIYNGSSGNSLGSALKAIKIYTTAGVNKQYNGDPSADIQINTGNGGTAGYIYGYNGAAAGKLDIIGGTGGAGLYYPGGTLGQGGAGGALNLTAGNGGNTSGTGGTGGTGGTVTIASGSGGTGTNTGTVGSVILKAGSTTVATVSNGTYKFDVATNVRIQGQTEIQTTTGAFIPPKLTTAQRNALTPTAGMTIFNTDTAALEVYNGAAWQNPVAYANTAANLFNYYNFS